MPLLSCATLAARSKRPSSDPESQMLAAAALPRGGRLAMCAGPYGEDAVALGLPQVLILLAAQAKTAPRQGLGGSRG